MIAKIHETMIGRKEKPIKGPKDLSHLVDMADSAAKQLRPYLIKKRDYAKEFPSKHWIKDELDTWTAYLKAQQDVVAQFTETYNRLAEDFEVIRREQKATEKRANEYWLLASKGAVTMAKLSLETIEIISRLKNEIAELKSQ